MKKSDKGSRRVKFWRSEGVRKEFFEKERESASRVECFKGRSKKGNLKQEDVALVGSVPHAIRMAIMIAYLRSGAGI